MASISNEAIQPYLVSLASDEGFEGPKLTHWSIGTDKSLNKREFTRREVWDMAR